MVERVSWLVTTLLKMARVDAGALNMQRETVSVSAMMRQALAPLELALDVRGIRCAVEISEDARYQGDMLWSAEAFENIVKNCMEHTPAGGTITIRAHADAVACRICVSDTGPGIAEADLPHIFDRFYRGSAHGIAPRSNAHAEGAAASDNFAMPAMHGVAGTPKTQSSIQGQAQDSTQNPAQDIPEPQGFGVGLALAHSIISAQGGTIRASNAPQAGACFSVTFPLITTL